MFAGLHLNVKTLQSEFNAKQLETLAARALACAFFPRKSPESGGLASSAKV
jgi:hypothetical protein